MKELTKFLKWAGGKIKIISHGKIKDVRGRTNSSKGWR